MLPSILKRNLHFYVLTLLLGGIFFECSTLSEVFVRIEPRGLPGGSNPLVLSKLIEGIDPIDLLLLRRLLNFIMGPFQRVESLVDGVFYLARSQEGSDFQVTGAFGSCKSTLLANRPVPYGQDMGRLLSCLPSIIKKRDLQETEQGRISPPLALLPFHSAISTGLSTTPTEA